MAYKVIGIEDVDYTNKNGRKIEGNKLHLTYHKDNCEGEAVQTVFASREVTGYVKVLDKIELFYNQYGKVIKVDVLDS